MAPSADQSILGRVARLVLRHRRMVFAAWAILFVAGIAASGPVSNRLTIDFSLPGQPGYETARQITQAFGNGGQDPPSIAVVTLPAGQSVRADGATVAAFSQVSRTQPDIRVVDYAKLWMRVDGAERKVLVFGQSALINGTTEWTQCQVVLDVRSARDAARAVALAERCSSAFALTAAATPRVPGCCSRPSSPGPARW